MIPPKKIASMRQAIQYLVRNVNMLQIMEGTHKTANHSQEERGSSPKPRTSALKTVTKIAPKISTRTPAGFLIYTSYQPFDLRPWTKVYSGLLRRLIPYTRSLFCLVAVTLREESLPTISAVPLIKRVLDYTRQRLPVILLGPLSKMKTGLYSPRYIQQKVWNGMRSISYMQPMVAYLQIWRLVVMLKLKRS